jgi:MFS family permease
MREQIPQVAPFLRVGGREWYLPHALQALNHPSYRLYWIGQLVSLTGSWMQSTAQQWLVYRLTGSPLALGAVMMASSLPVTLFSPFAGVLVDRVDKRRFIALVQVGMMALAFTLAGLVATGVVRYWHVVVLAALLGLANCLDMPARQAFTIEMVGREDLMSAVALNSSIFNGARLVGPAVAGLLIARVGEAPAFAINGLSFVAVIAALAAMRLPPPAPRAPRRHPLRELHEGVAYLWGDRRSLGLCTMATMASLFGFSFTTLIPVMAVERLGLRADGFGLLLSAMGAGALAGAASLTVLPESAKSRMLVVARFVFSIAIAAFALSTWLPLSLLALVVAGWGLIAHLATTNTMIQLAVPDALRGRVMAIYLWGVVGSAPLGNLFMGGLAERHGAPVAIASGAALCLLTAGVELAFFRRSGTDAGA